MVKCWHRDSGARGLTHPLADFARELLSILQIVLRGNFVSFGDVVLGVLDPLAHHREIESYGGIQCIAMARQIPPELVYRIFTFFH